jgi:hypothetical protein
MCLSRFPFVRIWVVSLALCALPASAAARFTVEGDAGQTPIVWGAMARPAPLPPLSHAALLVPVTLEGLESTRLHFQLDLGHTKTVLNSGKWAAIRARMAEGGASSGTGVPLLAFSAGTLKFSIDNIEIFERAGGIDWNAKNAEVIGTLGTDFIEGRIITLDFARNMVSLSVSRPEDKDARARYQPFSFQGRRLLLPARFEGKDISLMYDSGSSAFAWMTDEKTFSRLASPGAMPVSYPVNSWGKTLTAFTVASDAVVEVGGSTLPIKEVSRVEGMGFLQEMSIRLLGTGGLAGNKLFLGRVLVFDMRAKEFALL